MEQQPQKYTQLVKRNLRKQWRDEQRLAVKADTISVGVMLLAGLFATVTLGNSL